MSQMTVNSLFHKGELEVQALAGEQSEAIRVSRMIQETVPTGALQFLQQQFMIWISVEDNNNLPWAFPLSGSPGFVNPNQGELIEIDLNEKEPIPEKWSSYLQKGKFIGCLAIELASRRRLRINGIIKACNNQQLQIEVQQAYPNCPKYIRRREILSQPGEGRFQWLSSGTVLNKELSNIIKQSDTAFIASIGPNGADVSHRGGQPGFIDINSMNKITVPDYKGNSLFNTLGNFKLNPTGGLTIVEFNQGLLLQLTGKVNLQFDNVDSGTATGGTNRYWDLTVDKWHLFQLQPNIKWDNLDYSSYNPEA
jgi:hypothetical protein